MLQGCRLSRELFGSGGALLGIGGALLGHVVDLSQGLIDLVNPLRLFSGCRINLANQVISLAHPGDDFVQRLMSVIGHG